MAIAQLASDLEAQLRSMTPGERLQSSRAIVNERSVSPVTVSRAIALLVAKGLIVVRPGSGTFIAESAPAPRAADLSWQSATLGERPIDADGLGPLFEAPNDDGSISLSLGYLHPTLMPEHLLSTAWARAGRLPDAFHRPPTEGITVLRSWFAHNTAAGVEPRDVLIASGGQAAISAAIRAIAPPGSVLLVESPIYPGVIAIARAAGVTPFPVPVDADGIQIQALENTRWPRPARRRST